MNDPLVMEREYVLSELDLQIHDTYRKVGEAVVAIAKLHDFRKENPDAPSKNASLLRTLELRCETFHAIAHSVLQQWK